MPITQDTLQRLLSYEPETGVFTWRVPVGRWGRIPAGTVAGSVSNAEGYRYITIDNRLYRASRLAVLYMTGELPPDQVDHKNRNTGDDRWDNLRVATQAQNKANSGVYRNNTTGFKGVYFDKERGHWRAKAKVGGKRKWLGRFATKEDAYAAYCAAVEKSYGEFAAAA